uniref:Protein virilizer n=1 Tax=Steinernema glaseri TaxID=37863 RepID=A0A1I7XVW5_9BILA
MRFPAREDPQKRLRIPIALCLLLLHGAEAQTEVAPIARVTRPPDRFQKLPDLVCNDGTDYRCVCNRSLGNLDGELLPCNVFVQVEELPVVTLTARNINLTARLHTRETYESYFKRRIAHIVTNFCENLINECPGVALRLPKVSEEPDFLLDDYDEPLLTQDNVILLRVEYSEPTFLGASPDLVETAISFVVAKAPLSGSLNGYMTIPSLTVKNVLSGQVGTLSRVLGGIRIRAIEVSSISAPMPAADDSNTRLKVLLFCVATFFITCYVIAIYRICRDHRRKRRARKREAGLAGVEQANYGTCAEKKPVDDHGKANGRRRSKPDVEAAKQSLLEENHTATLVTQESEVMDPRRIQQMFAYDPSQLPAEPSFDEDEDYGIGREGGLRVEPKSDSAKERSAEPRSEALSLPAEELPSVVLVPSTSIHESRAGEISVADLNENYPVTEHEKEKNLLSSGYDSPPFERPRSRRGSRQSDTEAGEEGLETRELSPLPLGDEEFPRVTKSHTAHKFGHWSSDESDFEHSEVYGKLAEDEDDEEDLKRTVRRRRPSNSEENSENEDDVLERHHYERLQESPMPPLPDSLHYDSS